MMKDNKDKLTFRQKFKLIKSKRATKSKSVSPRRRFNFHAINNTLTNKQTIKNTKKAVLVGLNYTGTRNELKGCINDANRMKTTLTTKYEYKDVTVLTDQNLNRKNTVLTQFQKLLSSGSKNLFFQYSGHGVQVRDYDGSEEDGMDEALYSNDDIIITDDELNRVVAQVPRLTQLVIVVDACHSGTIIDLPYHLIDGKVVQINDKHVDADVICISGCKDDQVSMDIQTTTAYGAMSNGLQQVLTRVTSTTRWRDLIVMLNQTLQRDKYAQVPQLTVSRPELLDRVVDI